MTTARDTLADRLQFGLPDRLAKALEVAGVTSIEMAEYLDVSRNTVTNYTSGRSPVKKSTIRLWAVRTGVPMQWIETGMFPSDPKAPISNPIPAGSLAKVVELHPRGSKCPA